MRNKEEEMQNRFSWFRFGIVIILVALLICPVAMLLSYICDKVDPIVGLTISPILLSVCFTFLFYKLLKSEKAFQTIDLSKSERWIAYLEKQKEPHYTKRNELFDKCVENCGPEIMKEVSDVIDKELQKEQKPEEWSEEDEKRRKNVLRLITEADDKYIKEESRSPFCAEILWLKSLRGRPMISDNWKPSEEQMKNLEGAYKCELSAGLHTRAGILLTLYNDLKKLM